MNQAFKNILTPEFVEFVNANDFTQVQASYYPEHFGNVILVFANSDFSIRVAKDRGEVFVDVGPPNNCSQWFRLETVLDYLGIAVTLENMNEPPSVGTLAEQLIPNYDKVRGVLRSTSERRQLATFERAKGKSFSDALFGTR